LRSCGQLKPGRDQVLRFGMQSRLSELRVQTPKPGSTVYGRSFLHVSTRSLKVFRSKLEFEPGC
jgi:hypothetical protein